jgi:hypothetical protein
MENLEIKSYYYFPLNTSWASRNSKSPRIFNMTEDLLGAPCWSQFNTEMRGGAVRSYTFLLTGIESCE